MADLKCELSAERLIHKQIHEFATLVYNKHRIRINNVTISWFDVSAIDRRDMIVDSVRLDSTIFEG